MSAVLDSSNGLQGGSNLLSAHLYNLVINFVGRRLNVYNLFLRISGNVLKVFLFLMLILELLLPELFSCRDVKQKVY